MNHYNIHKRLKSITVTIFICLSLITFIQDVRPVRAVESEFPDRVFLFNCPTTEYSFDLNFEKNEKYQFLIQLYTPHSVINVQCYLIGPDSDGDGDDDYYHIGGGVLSTADPVSVSFEFGAAITGSYNFSVVGTCDENVNLHIKVEHRGSCFTSGGAIDQNIDGFYHQKKRTRYFPLESDTEYQLNVMRTNTINDIQLDLYVTASLFDEQNNEFYLIEHDKIISGFNPTTEYFGTASEGQYRLEIEIFTDIPTVNLLIELFNSDLIGDGPDNSTEEEEDLDDYQNSSTPIEVNVPVQVFLFIGVGGVAIFFLAYITNGGFGKKSKSRV